MDHVRMKMGEALVAYGLISVEQLERALDEQRREGGRIGEVLVRQQVLTEEQIIAALAEREGIRRVDLTRIDIDPVAVALVPVKYDLRRSMLPIGFEDGHLVVAMADPLDLRGVDEAELLSGYKVEPVIASETQIRYAIEKYAVEGALVGQLQLDEDGSEEADEESEGAAIEVPIVRVVNQMLRGAVLDRASDIHFEPEEHMLRVRSRVDGVLMETAELPKSSEASMLSRLKVMADIDIIERRRPQDGRISLRVDNRTVDMRVATLPTPLGESMVVRILDKDMQSREADDLGMSAENRTLFDRMLARPYGALLVSGPTGSGKTTTLYAALNQLNEPTRKIITIEDPVEYRMAGLTQMSVNPRIGLTFAAGLRGVLRADPDIVMVGEIRDGETAQIAIRAAITGHFVLSSIHTNDAPSALTRLADMGVEPYVSSSALVGALAQRLVRVLCPRCKTPVDASPETLTAAGFTEEESHSVKPHGPVGCQECRRTGYRGRAAVFEIMEMTPHLRELLLRNAPSEEVRGVALEEGMRSLRRDVLDKVASGITSLEELARVVA